MLLLLCASLCPAQIGSPVVVDGVELWRIPAPRAGSSPEERARDTAAGIQALATDGRSDASQSRDVHLDTESILLIGRNYVFSVTDEDARLQGAPRRQLFEHHKQLTLDAIRNYRASHEWSTLLRSAGISAAVIALMCGVLVLLHRLFVRISRWALVSIAWKSRKGKLASIYELFEAPLEVALRIFLRVVFASIHLIVIFASLSYCFGLFPSTRAISGQVVALSIDSIAKILRGTIEYLPNLLVLVAVAAATYLLIQVAKVLARAIDAGRIKIQGFHQDWAQPTYDLVKVLLILFALVVSFPYLPGGDSPALRGVSIFIGVLVSLGSGSAMGNVVSGVILTYMRPFQLGDRVQIADTIGDITEKSLLVTRVRTIKNVEIILPNSSVLGAHILNYSALAQSSGLILNTTVTIGYDAPWPRVHELLIQAALRVPGVVAEPRPFVLQTALNDYNVSYQINAYTNRPNQMAELYSELHRMIQEEFNHGGVEIMSPAYHAIRDGNTVTIPAAHRPADYQPPGFHIER